jgi:hypothetical protein
MSASSAAWPGPALEPAKLLTLGFEGYYMCRLATDPDPTDEHRGMSGYTMALSAEDPLDRIIRLEVDEEFAARNLRPPARDRGVEIGVRVTAVAFDGRPWPDHALVGARVRLGGRDEPADGPVFESRNNLTGSDDNFAFVVDPFCLHVESTRGSIAIRAEDHIDPAHPGRPIWEVLDPSIYGRRLPRSVESNSTEVAQAIGVFDLYGYFRDRRRYLREQIRLGERVLAEVPMKHEAEREAIETSIQQFRSRLYQLEFWGDRMIGKLGNKVDWAFDINGRQEVTDPDGQLRGTADLRQPWPIRFWFGGWDGDLLVGYLRGNLGLPFTVAK